MTRATRPSSPPRLPAIVLAVLALVGVVATPAPAHASTLGGPISRAEVIQRAQYWVDHQPGPTTRAATPPVRVGTATTGATALATSTWPGT